VRSPNAPIKGVIGDHALQNCKKINFVGISFLRKPLLTPWCDSHSSLPLSRGRNKPGFPDGHELAYHSLLVSKISKMTANPVSMHQMANLYSGRQITE
jgi:hypothetical protein